MRIIPSSHHWNLEASGEADLASCGEGSGRVSDTHGQCNVWDKESFWIYFFHVLLTESLEATLLWSCYSNRGLEFLKVFHSNYPRGSRMSGCPYSKERRGKRMTRRWGGNTSLKPAVFHMPGLKVKIFFLLWVKLAWVGYIVTSN